MAFFSSGGNSNATRQYAYEGDHARGQTQTYNEHEASAVQVEPTEKLLTPGSPMESLRRRQYNRPTSAQVQQSNAVAPTSPLVAVPIVETQIGIKKAGPSTGPPPEKVPNADAYPDPGIEINWS